METQFSTISITMPKVKISMLEKNTFIYEIDVATRWARWHLQKRYAQFLELHTKLQAEFDNLPQFPQSFLNMFMVQTEDQASEYQEILETYLQQTSKRKDIINSQVFSQFLQLQKNSPMILARKPKLIHQFEMEMRINDEGKVILDYFYDDNFIVFATGNDNPMEKFNSLVANSKFPWEQQQEVEYVLPLGTIECWLKKKELWEYKRVWARNYGIQTRSFIFSLTSMIMVVGLSDGSIEVFKLINKPRYVYYQLPTMIQAHSDDVIGLFLDEVNMVVYSASTDGWINMIDATRSVVINKLELASQITKIHGDTVNRRLFVALEDGNIEIFQYENARLKFLYSLCSPVQGELKTLLFDPVKNYLFSSCYETGEILVFEIGKSKYEKLSKQIGFLKNKQKIVDLIWKPQKMELLACTRSGEIFFWNTVKGEHIFMLKAFEDIDMSKCMYIKEKNLIITASRGRKVKFWQIPITWRDTMAEVQEEREIEIRRKVQNMYKVREAVKRKAVNSDQDDLKGWHWNESEQQQDQ